MDGLSLDCITPLDGFRGNPTSLTASPAGPFFLVRQKEGKERLKGVALENPTRGFPLDLPAAGTIWSRTPLRLPRAIWISPSGIRVPPPALRACGAAAFGGRN